MALSRLVCIMRARAVFNLLGPNGGLGRLDRCVLRAENETQIPELGSVGNIMMELLQKYVKDDGKVGIDDLNRWSSDSIPVNFLSATTSSDSIESLMQVCAS